MGAAIYRDGRYVWVNAALAHMLGWERPADLVGRALVDDVHPLDREQAGARLRGPSGKAQIGRVRVLRRDGSTAIYDVAASQEVVFDGKSARLIVGNDVTERVRVRQQLAVSDRMAAVGMLAAFICRVLPMRAKISSWLGASAVAAGEEASGVASTSAHCFNGPAGCSW